MRATMPLRDSNARHALTAAALALPGLVSSGPSAAQDGTALVQFGRYQEDARDLFGLSSKYDPLRSDSLLFSADAPITDRLRAVLNFRQDTWSGATPIATAPREWRGNRSRAPDGVSGASPFIAPGQPLYLDKATLAPLRTDGFGNLVGGQDTQLVHTIAGASRETRRQVDFDAQYDGGEFALGLNGGVSSEPDYLSRFVGASGRWDFNQKLTALNVLAGYTSSRIGATLDHDAVPYIFNACGNARCNFVSATSRVETGDYGRRTVVADRRDVTGSIGLSQVLGRGSQVQANLGYTESRGYLSNPYKVVEVAFIDPALQFLSPSPDAAYVTVNALLDNRPDVRRQWTLNARYAQFVEAADAGLHLGYTYFRDDWGVRAHTVDASWIQPVGAGWTITPSIRYYTQTAATFYTPYLVTDQGQYREVTDPSTGATTSVPFDLSKLPAHYSSDYRLSAFGTLGGGITAVREFSRGVTASLGVLYYDHSGKLKWGGGGEGSYTDFSAWVAYASMAVDLNAASTLGAAIGTLHAGHGGSEEAPHLPAAPAGVLFDHVPSKAGGLMVGMRAMGDWQAGGFRNGTGRVGDDVVKAQACDPTGCLVAPTTMTMSMSMLEIMFTPADGVAIMVMPSYVTMAMDSRGLIDASEQAALTPELQAIYLHHVSHANQTGGIGDTGLHVAFALVDLGDWRVHATLGVIAPTGAVNLKLRDTHQIDAGYEHYGMQLGSGTWDLQSSLTVQGASGPWFGGAQVGGIARLQSRNASGYALGDVVQGTAWGGYEAGGGLTLTLRGAYTRQGSIRGGYEGTFHPVSPPDFTSNYGGRYLDLGIGANVRLRGAYAGNDLGIEWMQPLRQDVDGYQLNRRGSLQARWQLAF